MLRSASFISRYAWCARKGLVGVLAISLVGGQAAYGSARPGAQSRGSKQNRNASHTMRTGQSSVFTKRPIVMVFPLETNGGVSDQLADDVTDVEQSRLEAGGNYHALYFLRSLPTVKRALSEQTLSTSDLTPPYTDTKLKRVAQAAGYYFVLVSSIDDYTYDASKGQVSMVMSARLVNFTSGNAEPRSATLSGNTAEKAVHDEKDVKSARLLARDLTEKLMNSLLGAKAAAPAAGTSGTKSSKPPQ